MRVNVFAAADYGSAPHQLLVLPYGPLSTIPCHLKHLKWRNLSTATTDDKLLRAPASRIDADIAANGHALVEAIH